MTGQDIPDTYPPEMRQDLADAAIRLAEAPVKKWKDLQGVMRVDFTLPDFLRVMKVVAGVHVLLRQVEALEKRVKELEAWQSEYAGLVCAHGMELPEGLSAVHFSVSPLALVNPMEQTEP